MQSGFRKKIESTYLNHTRKPQIEEVKNVLQNKTRKLVIYLKHCLHITTFYIYFKMRACLMSSVQEAI